MLVPVGSQVRAAPPAVRPIRESELIGWGFVVVRTLAELEHAAEAGATVLWLHRDALPLIDSAWMQARYREGLAVGLIDGNMVELMERLDLGPAGSGWLRSDQLWLPTFAVVWQVTCPSRVSHGGGAAERLSPAWLLATSSRAAATSCGEREATPAT